MKKPSLLKLLGMILVIGFAVNIMSSILLESGNTVAMVAGRILFVAKYISYWELICQYIDGCKRYKVFHLVNDCNQ